MVMSSMDTPDYLHFWWFLDPITVNFVDDVAFRGIFAIFYDILY